MKKYFILFSTTLILFVIGANAQSSPVKKVLLEEFTTALCGMCPMKSYDINQWRDANTSKCVLMTHHSGFGTDAMTNPIATGMYSCFAPSTFGFAPAIMIDRDVYPWLDSVPYMTVNGFDTVATRVANDPAMVDVQITGSYNITTRALTVTATANFSQIPGSDPLRLNIYLVEDSIIGTGSGYDQKCYDANFANLHYPGQYNSTTQLISGYPHRYVARKELTTGIWGPSGIIPATPVINTPYSTTVTYTVPANYIDTRCRVVAYVANHGSTKRDRNVLNATDVKLYQLSNVGMESPGETLIHALYPNPVGDHLNCVFSLTDDGINSVYVADITGRKVLSLSENITAAAGRYEVSFDVSTLESGVYFLTIGHGNSKSNSKFIKY